ncbi:Thaumatin-like protein 1 [Ranunculus cassubicifolius]
MEPKILLMIVVATMIPGTFSATFTFVNKCPFTIWPGILTNANSPAFPSTGFELGSGASQPFDSPAGWGGRFWARTGCTNNGQFTCATGNCGNIDCNGAGGAPPTTLVEFTLASSANPQDFYDVSLVDGFNLPVSVEPQGGSGCNPSACAANVNSLCPPELSPKGADGSTIACKSACLAFNQPQYCCTDAFNTPDTCKPTPYSTIFKNACPQAYSYAYDDKTSTFTCSGGANYLITFCP